MLRKTLLIGAAALPIVAGAAGTPAAKGFLDDLDIGTFSANVGIFSDYVFRGISQTNESPALQGGIDWSHGLGPIGEQTGVGAYIGVWASNVDFVGVTSETVEMDLYGGFAGEVPVGMYLQSIGYDVGGIFYWYPGSSEDLNLAYIETYGGLSFNFEYFSIGGTVYYSPEYTGDTGEAVFVEGNLEVPLPHGFTLVGTGGYFTVQDNPRLGLPDYWTWSAGLDFSLGTVHSNLDPFTLGFRYVDTDISNPATAPACLSSLSLCDERFLVSLTAEIGG